MKTKISTIEGMITDISEFTSSKYGTDRRFWVIRIDGKDYFTFTYPDFCVNNYVKATYKQAGSFREIINITQIKRTIFDF